jgi:hypothetical protein
VKRIYSIALFLAATAGCYGPYPEAVYEEIQTNETAFLVPLEGDTAMQEKAKTIEALETAKVYAKRVEIPLRKRKLGRGFGRYEWVATMKVIRVDRSPVTREWTAEATTGTTAADQALYVESKDSINFGFSATITAHVEDADAARYLYYFAGKQLSDIIDQNIRGMALQLLAEKAGRSDLATCITDKHVFMEETETALREQCAAKGITIDFFGGIKGIQIADAMIQEAVDSKFIGEINAQTAEQELEVQAIRNEIQVAAAEADRQAAQELFVAKDALQLKTSLEVLRINAEATKIAASKWKGALPSDIIPSGTHLLFGLEQHEDLQLEAPEFAVPRPAE